MFSSGIADSSSSSHCIRSSAPNQEAKLNAELIRYVGTCASERLFSITHIDNSITALLLDASDAQLSLDWDGDSLAIIYEGGKGAPRQITNVFARELAARMRRDSNPSEPNKRQKV